MTRRVLLSLLLLCASSIMLAGALPTAHAATAGLVAAYSFDEGTGASVADRSGNGNAGSLSGPAWTSAGKYGAALSFDGVNDLVTIPDSASLDLTSAMTLEAWVQPSALGSSWRTVLVKEQPSQLAYALYAHDGGPGPSGHVYSGSDKYVASSLGLALGSWTHLATTYDGSRLTVYVNGKSVASRSLGGKIATSAGALRIGGNNVWPEWFKGQIDEVRVYNRALTSTEVQSDMATPIGGAVPADTSPPTEPGNVAVTGTSSTTISISWSPSSDNVGVAGYTLRRDGATTGTTTGTVATFSGLACGTSYTLGVSAYDGAGNSSTTTSITAATAACSVADTQPPSIPTGLSASAATATTVALGWHPSSDNVGVAGYDLYLNSAKVGSTTTTSYTFGGLSCATGYTLAVVAFDAAGNRSASASLAASTSACSASGTLANLWVDTNGGSCLDSATPVAYSDAAACSWAQANASCEGGDTVRVKGGSYGDVTIRGSNGRSSACTFQTAAAETVVVGSLNLGEWQTCSYGATSTTTTNWFTLIGPLKSREFHADCSNQVTIDNLDMDAGGAPISQPFQVQAGATNFTLRNSKVHNALNPNAMMVLEGSNYTIDNNDIYDDINNTGGAIHDECLRAQPVDNMTMTRNHFWSCNVMDVFITGSEYATNWTVENNIFEAPTGSAGNAANAFAFRGDSSSGVTPSPDGFVMRYNTFGSSGVQVNQSENGPTARGFTVVGNYFATNAPCGLSNTTYAYNITPTGVANCGGTGAQSFAASTLNAGFVNYHPYSGNGGGSSEPAGDYRLLGGSPLIDRGTSGNYPSVDRIGRGRYSGSAPDVGSYEGT